MASLPINDSQSVNDIVHKEQLVSIIIPAFNAEKTLANCLDSVLKQDYFNIEILLINDGSSDKTEIIANQYQEQNNKIKVFTKENGGGPSSARNYGLNKATGDYVCFVDSDDTICSNYISEMVNNIESHDLLIANINTVLNDIDILFIGKKKYPITLFQHSELFFNNISMILNNSLPVRNIYAKLFKTEKIKNLNLRFNENIFYGEDYLFVLEYIKNCSSIKFINTKIYNYFHIKNSITKRYQDNLFEQTQLLMNNIKSIYGQFFQDIEKQWNNLYINNLFTVILNVMRYANKITKKYLINKIFNDNSICYIVKTTKPITKKIKIERFILKKKSYTLLKIMYKIYNLKKHTYYNSK